MQWYQLPEVVSAWTLKSAEPGIQLRREVSSLITTLPVGYYFNPESDRFGVLCEKTASPDAYRAKVTVASATGTPPLFLSYQDISAADSTWVKVAYSPTLHRAGQLLNFFPGQYAGGIPNAPSPVAAMLTSGLLGAGLGWGAGRLLGAALPRGYGHNLGRTGMIVGGMLGAAPGAAWGLANKTDGRGFNDPSLLDTTAPPTSEFFDGTNTYRPHPDGISPTNQFISNTAEQLQTVPMPYFKHGSDVVLSEMYKTAVAKVANTFGTVDPRGGYLPSDVNIDHLGRTLWDADASPALAATTMASMYAAQQLPDPHSRPGYVTGRQLGQLAANAAGDYATGFLVGKAINAVIGTPVSAPAFGVGHATLGVLGAVVPKLFGG